MRKLLAATAAMGLALTAAPAISQDMDTMDGEMMELTTAQQTMYDGWPEDRRTTYDAWPMNAQQYYWTLDSEQQDTWWTLLNNDQRVRIVGMTPEQRTAAWTSINAQIAGTAPAATSTMPATTASAPASTMGATNASTTATTRGNVQFVRNEMAQRTPANYRSTANATDLPVCSANQQDGCINSWEKNRTGNRPLNYWPGRPASEM